MRLLNVYSFAFREFYGEQVPKYAIASHRWQSKEAGKKDTGKRRNTHTVGYAKVVAFARYIRQHLADIEWLWMDTCCIDQKNSQEVSEGINSMFEWYADAEICLAYLADVDGPENFSKSVWFKRGWTLQELLAPDTVLFLTKDWQVIGHKTALVAKNTRFGLGASLIPSIAKVTSIDEAILENYQQSKSMSVQERLQWMTNR